MKKSSFHLWKKVSGVWIDFQLFSINILLESDSSCSNVSYRQQDEFVH